MKVYFCCTCWKWQSVQPFKIMGGRAWCEKCDNRLKLGPKGGRK